MILQLGPGSRFCFIWPLFHEMGAVLPGGRDTPTKRVHPHDWPVLAGEWMLRGATSQGSHSSPCGLHMFAWTPQKCGSVRENPWPCSAIGQALACKHLASLRFTSHLLMSHWPKKVTWQSSAGILEEPTLYKSMTTLKGRVHWEPRTLWNSGILWSCACFHLCNWLVPVSLWDIRVPLFSCSFTWYEH